VRVAGREARIPTRACENRSSDHWSYEKAGMPAVRIGSIPYAAYHSRRDVPSVVSRVQLDRVGRLVWAWLN
jgi:Iap family predicted aminopeptidase